MKNISANNIREVINLSTKLILIESIYKIIMDYGHDFCFYTHAAVTFPSLSEYNIFDLKPKEVGSVKSGAEYLRCCYMLYLDETIPIIQFDIKPWEKMSYLSLVENIRFSFIGRCTNDIQFI